MNIKTVGIIGGNGKMGAYFARFFKNYGYKVIISDIGTKLTNKKVATQADLLIFSVPINKTVPIIEEVTENIKKDALIMDVTSIKKPAVDAMLKTKAKYVVGTHPMFAPTVSIVGQVFVLSKGRGEKGYNFLKKIFEDAGAIIREINAEKHDELMTVVQTLNHFTDIAFARALSKTGLEIHDFLELQSPSYRLRLIMMGRILAQNGRLYGNIMTQNPLNKKAIKIFHEASSELEKIVKSQNLKKFEKYFDESSEYLQDFAETAMKESDMIIKQIFQKNVNDAQWKNNKTADIAILGPKNTYSDFACDEVFGQNTERKYCKTIKEVFETISREECKKALIPITNNLAGAVSESYNSFWAFDDIEIVAEMNLRIVHVLAALGDYKLDEIEEVFSHSSPLDQCSDFLDQYRNMKKIAVASTAEAALHLNGNNAAIIPERAAKNAHLTILKRDISNSKDNFTRFYLIQKKSKKLLI